MKFIVLAAVSLLAIVGCSDGSVAPLSSASSAPAAAVASSAPAAPVAAIAPIVLTGSGSMVPHITLKAATYIVTWAAHGGTCYGSAGCSGDNFIVDIVGGNGATDGIVNEITSNDINVGSRGEGVYTVHQSGAYLLKVDASTLVWMITFTQA